MEDVEAIVRSLTKADQRALATRSGQGEYSSACLDRLSARGLVDPLNFEWTKLGWEVITRLHPHLAVRQSLQAKE